MTQKLVSKKQLKSIFGVPYSFAHIARLEVVGQFPQQRPWRVVEHAASFTVQDATGQNMDWFHFRNDPGIVQSVAVLFKEEARQRAMNFTEATPASTRHDP